MEDLFLAFIVSLPFGGLALIVLKESRKIGMLLTSMLCALSAISLFLYEIFNGLDYQQYLFGFFAIILWKCEDRIINYVYGKRKGS